MSKKKFMLFLILPLLITLFGISYSAEAAGQEDISFSITSPKEQLIITQKDETLNLDILGIKSTFQIKQVTATIDKLTTSLQYSNGKYSAKIPLSTFTEGAKKVTITATDVYGNSKSISTNFQYIKQPIHITSPISNDFYNKTDIMIKATAKNFAGSKAKFFVTVDGKTIATGTKNSINQKVDLSTYNGKAITLKFTIKNTSTGLRYTESHKIYVDDSPLLTKLEKVDGEMLEFQNGKLLYKNSKNEIWMKDIHSKTNNLVYKNTTDDYSYGFLTDTSLIFLTKSETAGLQNLYQYNDVAKQIGSTMNHQTVSAAGNYLIWNGSLMENSAAKESHVYFKQLETSKTVSIAETDSPYNVYVNEAGESYYHTSSGTFKYSQGLTSKISDIGSIQAAEGDLFLYETSNPEFSEVFVKWQGGSDQKLNTFSDYYDELIPEYSRPNSILKNGSIAFEKYQNKKFDIYLWNKGEEKKLSTFHSSTRLASFSGDGMIMTKDNYLLKSEDNYGMKPIKLFNLPMDTYWEGKQAYGIFAGNLVSITTNHTPVTGITMSQKAVSLLEKKTKQLKVVITPANATFTKVIWSSSNPKVVTVDSKGKVTGKVKGEATITARSVDGSIKASTAITVADVTPPAAPTINKVTNKAKTITGKAEADSTVKIYIKGKYTGSTKASANKSFSFKIKPQKTGTVIKAIAIDSSTNKSKAKSSKVN